MRALRGDPQFKSKAIRPYSLLAEMVECARLHKEAEQKQQDQRPHEETEQLEQEQGAQQEQDQRTHGQNVIAFLQGLNTKNAKLNVFPGEGEYKGYHVITVGKKSVSTDSSSESSLDLSPVPTPSSEKLRYMEVLSKSLLTYRATLGDESQPTATYPNRDPYIASLICDPTDITEDPPTPAKKQAPSSNKKLKHRQTTHFHIIPLDKEMMQHFGSKETITPRIGGVTYTLKVLGKFDMGVAKFAVEDEEMRKFFYEDREGKTFCEFRIGGMGGENEEEIEEEEQKAKRKGGGKKKKRKGKGKKHDGEEDANAAHAEDQGSETVPDGQEMNASGPTKKRKAPKKKKSQEQSTADKQPLSTTSTHGENHSQDKKPEQNGMPKASTNTTRGESAETSTLHPAPVKTTQKKNNGPKDNPNPNPKAKPTSTQPPTPSSAAVDSAQDLSSENGVPSTQQPDLAKKKRHFRNRRCGGKQRGGGDGREEGSGGEVKAGESEAGESKLAE